MHGLMPTIVLSVVLAFPAGFVARKLGLPPLVGYLVAGMALGPFTPGFVGNRELIGELAEIGVILLMFGVGLHFAIKDLLGVRKVAVPTALVQMAVATALGVGLGHMLGWSLAGGLVLGLALSVASTVVALRALEERNTLDSINGQIAVGALIVQDLAMVLVLVLLPAFGGEGAPMSGTALASNLALTCVKVGAFLAFVLIVGKRLVPWVLEHVARTGSRELFTLSVLATALGIAYGSAALFGVSFALGAFFAGVVLSETDFSYQAAADSLPLQDAFAVLFFVSIGMLFDPSILTRAPLAVLATVVVIMVLKSVAAFVAVLAVGYAVPTALVVTASLAQIGEFSFILAGLGIDEGLLPAEGRDLILAGALLSITFNPLLFGVLNRVGSWMRKHPRFTASIERVQSEALATLPKDDDGVSGHMVIVGYGRVGGVVGKGLKAQALPIVVVEQDRRRVEALRERGIAAVYGDASTPGVLKAARTDVARLIVIATPEGFQTRRIIALARELNPAIEIAVRTHSELEVGYLEKQGVGLAIMGEREMAFGLLGFALQALGVTEEHARAVTQKLRVAGDGGAFERRPDAPAYRAPELKHRETDQGRD